MKIVGLTGGIGSGKTLVANYFKDLGVPVYIADVEAKKILATSKVVRRKIIQLLGTSSFINGKPNKSFIAQKIFNDKELLAAVNGIIHPKVASHFKRWIAKNEGDYCVKEAAILFENGGYESCDYTILVTAPIETRIARVIKRDGVSRAQVTARMANQWDDAAKKPLATYVLENTALDTTKEKVFEIHQKIKNS